MAKGIIWLGGMPPCPPIMGSPPPKGIMPAPPPSGICGCIWGMNIYCAMKGCCGTMPGAIIICGGPPCAIFMGIPPGIGMPGMGIGCFACCPLAWEFLFCILLVRKLINY